MSSICGPFIFGPVSGRAKCRLTGLRFGFISFSCRRMYIVFFSVGRINLISLNIIRMRMKI